MNRPKLQRKHAFLLLLLLALLTYIFSLPKPLFDGPMSQVLESKTGELLGARIASDGQWRFPVSDSIPEKFKVAITQFEDRRFYQHWGVDIRALFRATRQNLRAGHIVSGGSTLTMQNIRLSRKAKQRNIWNKLIEILLATRLEWRHSKDKILHLYAANAPFGGNVVGLDAAAWRYFGKAPSLLSWSEAATLAVLPNSPALIHPGRNRDALLKKRNRLLDRLLAIGQLDSLSCALAKAESLPERPLPLPRFAPHLLDRAMREHGRHRLRTTIDANVQNRLNAILARHQSVLRQNHIYNAAAIVIEVETGDVLAYIGNVAGAGASQGEQVDVISAPRSTGSILKPFLYAAMLQDGNIVPNSLIADIPTQIDGYRPENFHKKYDGAVSAKRAIVRSLNIPIVRMLQNYGLEKFHYRLQQLNFKTINQSPNHYGLTLALGGAEATLEQVSITYTSMARTLNHFADQSGRYNPKDFRGINYVKNKTKVENTLNLQKEAPHFNAASIYQTFEAMREVERPNSEGEWSAFSSRRKIAWKTGTSFGFRDAWAVGLDTRYVVGVWVGNADGEGRPGLVGVKAAAPILFDIFKELPQQEAWFEPPYDELIRLPICKASGYRPLSICPVDTIWANQNALNLGACTYHQEVHLDASQQWRVHSDCETPHKMQHRAWFVLPPVQEFYYKSKHPAYQVLPPLRPDCASEGQQQPMQLIYPKRFAKITLPIDLDGERSSTVFQAAHRTPEMEVYWHLDSEYIGKTQHFHELPLQPDVGLHTLTLVDAEGNRLEQAFEIVE